MSRRVATALLGSTVGRWLVGPNSCGIRKKRELAVAVVRRDVLIHRPSLSAPLGPHPEPIS
jgi:hypothetical protein